MKKLMTLLAVITSLAVFSPTPADARDRHHHRSHHHSSRHYTSYRHHHHYSRPYLYSGYRSSYYGDRVIIGYDRYGYPIYGYGSPRYYPRHRSYISTPGFHLSFWR